MVDTARTPSAPDPTTMLDHALQGSTPEPPGVVAFLNGLALMQATLPVVQRMLVTVGVKEMPMRLERFVRELLATILKELDIDRLAHRI